MAKANILPIRADEQEDWLPIPGLEFYEASSLGRIRSMDRVLLRHKAGGIIPIRWKTRILSGARQTGVDGSVYLVFKPVTGNGSNYRYNRVICLAFNGPPPTAKHEAAHLDGNSLNNRPENLVWATPKENSGHKILHGTSGKGALHPNSKLTDADIHAIFVAYAGGELTKKLAPRFGITAADAVYILGRKTWSHVPVDPDLIATARFRAKENHRLALVASNKARSGLPVKTRHSILNDDLIPGIFVAYINGESFDSIGQRLGITRSYVHAILSRKARAHVEVDPVIVEKAQMVAKGNRSPGAPPRPKTT